MKTAYRVVGSSNTRPENLPEGFTVKERLVGETLELHNRTFIETKDGAVVMFIPGVDHSNVKIDPDDVGKLMVFLNRVYNSHVAGRLLEAFK